MPRNLVAPVVHVNATVCFYLACAMLVPAMYDGLVHKGTDYAFVHAAVVVGIVSGLSMIGTRGIPVMFTRRLGFMIVGTLWASVSIAGAVPLYMAMPGLSLTDALFESASGLTTTGATVLTGLDTTVPGVLLWRSMLQWLGGIGILSMGILLLPVLRVGGMQLFQIESSERSENPLAHFTAFALAVFSVYCTLTAACFLAYAAAGMSMFDALNHSMTTLSTGGFSTHDASFGAFSGVAIPWIATTFMLLGGLPFMVYIRVLVRSRRTGAADLQVPVFLGTIVLVSVGTALTLTAETGTPLGSALTHATFNIVSVITTTGYATQDYQLWGPVFIAIFFAATFVGGCTGSTAGGIKLYRFIVMSKVLDNGIKAAIYPNGIFPLRYGDRVLSDEVVRSVIIFLSAFLGVLTVGTIALAALGLDLTTALTGTLSALANVGPGLGQVIGPSGNYASLGDTAKLILTLIMILGRLEIVALLVLVSPIYWSQ